MSLTPPIEVATIGMWDSLILMVMALVVFGPRRLPEIGRQIGKLMYEVRKASNDFKFQMEEELRKSEEAERKSKEQGLGTRDPIPALAARVDSQVMESGVGAPSPYPGEGVYPSVSPAEFQQVEPYPRIQPPSTGEPVAAARPEFTEQKIPESSVTAAAETVPAAEQARHA
ncbi:MAG: twin-arginine translocase TatA/TatE family subunit [Terracidiphilus sp.]